MLKINRQTNYAVCILPALAKRGEGIRFSSAGIQQEILIPPALMARIISQLAREGLANTLPDHDGSLMLREMAAITFESLVQEALSIPLAMPSMAF